MAQDITKEHRQQIIDMIAEVMWNGEGAPSMSDEAYAEKYVADATEQYADYEAGTLEPWWQE